MSSDERASGGRSESPDPSSHATNIYDTTEAESEWLDEDGSEYFDPTEDFEDAFEGM